MTQFISVQYERVSWSLQSVYSPDPFQVVNIKKITREAGQFRLKVSLFYRPEDTHKGSNASETVYNNELFFTEEEATVIITEMTGEMLRQVLRLDFFHQALDL